eukprot:CAMPEP_0172492676 /NCGR_PEP_ID=MMETSP1066-20121228/23911_1 /TAXON_ID=671091 /ORGANISM="Coscinodiscus wailesii, Strain CCMP2513" /LENGTH=52 /DNA_ID=CAMNT_0013262445 /DNA_START=338 /DNA_END=493 /DNA_ORIENTATION=+
MRVYLAEGYDDEHAQAETLSGVAEYMRNGRYDTDVMGAGGGCCGVHWCDRAG